MVLNAIKDWAVGSDEEEYNASGDLLNSTNEFEEYAGPSSFEMSADPSSSLDFSNKPSQMVVIEPTSYAECEGIAAHLKSGRGCIVNLHRVSKDQAVRIVDFIYGVVFAIEGDVQKIGQGVFLMTPPNFGVVGEYTGQGSTEE